VIENLRNIAIIAHVDHGKTTLVDQLLQQSGTLGERAAAPERVMDSNELERERGITILSKNTAIDWNDGEQNYHINIVDTPGHADFGGEVERILSMVDSVLLLVDAVDGPMPQTRFVTQKAFEMGFRPIVVINKIDRDGARPDWVLDQTFELFDQLGANDEQLDFPVVYASALRGYASLDASVTEGDMQPLFETIVEQVAAPPVNVEGPFQMRVSSLDYSAYVGVIGIGRVQRGGVKPNQQICVIDCDGRQRNARVLQVLGFRGLERVEVPSAQAGDIIAITGVENLQISDTARPDRRRTDHQHDLPGQQLALRRARRQIPHQPPTARAIDAGGQPQCGTAIGGHREPGAFQGFRPWRAAPVHPDRNHAPRGLRAGDFAAGGDHPRDRSRP
jgi:GTP-binding protein